MDYKELMFEISKFENAPDRKMLTSIQVDEFYKKMIGETIYG